MKIIDTNLLDNVAAEAKESPRLRKNYNFHQNLSDKCHRFLNAMEPGTFVPIHHHPTKDETVIILRGRVRVSTYSDDGKVLERGTHDELLAKNGAYAELVRND